VVQTLEIPNSKPQIPKKLRTANLQVNGTGSVFRILDLEFSWKLDVGIWNFGVMTLLFKEKTAMQLSVLMILERNSAAA
jgi:hypothetical protein